jgi:putative hydrolase of the HAD superfamily
VDLAPSWTHWLEKELRTVVLTSKKPIRGVIFDAVGTIMDPAPSVSEVYTAAAARQGVKPDLGTVKQRFRRAFARDEVCAGGEPLATDEATEVRRWRRIVDECLPEVPDAERAFGELWEHFGRPESWRAYPEAAWTMKLLGSAGYGVIVASNFDGRLRSVLRGLDELAGWAETVVISSEVGRRKPHPRFYEAACDRLGLPPDRVLCVGDDEENDWNGPRRAGLSAVLVDRRQRISGPVERVSCLDALLGPLLGPYPAGLVP